jgi:hypothetical protein
MINIKGIDKAELIAALYNGTPALGLGVLHDIGTMSVEKAREVVAVCEKEYGGRLRFDYLLGHPLKCDVTSDEFEEVGYDRDAGRGAAALIVANLHAQKEAA